MNIEESPFQFMDNTPKIRVIIRKRPLGKKELNRNDNDIIDVKGPQTLAVRETKTKVDLTKYIEEHIFNFDKVFDENSSNEKIYLETVRPLVESAFNSAKVTCFAYGQTGSGKTFTMMGEAGSEKGDNYKTVPVPGLYLLAAQDVFTLLEQPCFQHLAVYISFYEIYCTKLHDLLNDRQQLFAREDGKQKVNIVGLSEKRVLNVHSLMQIIDFGHSVRTTSSTSANDDSSRSHAILQITLKNGNKTHGKMSFIDLAGSERGADVVETNKQTRMDGAEINKSLLALKECIRALDLDKRHTPFRGSKLTLVLKDSFTGNCKTVMIGNISPATSACEHTLNTLRYADRVKELKKPSNENSAPLSQGDLLAQQLMLPRQTKNTVRIPLQNEDENVNSQNMMNMPLLNNPSGKSSKSRHSMPVFGNLQSFQGMQGMQGMGYPQGQYNPNQYTAQNMNYNNMNNMYNPSSENLFSIEEHPQPQQLLYNKQEVNNFGFKGNTRPLSSNFQPNLFQNSNIPQTSNQVNMPYNFSAQINLSKKKASDEQELLMDPRRNNSFGGIDKQSPNNVPYVQLRNNVMNDGPGNQRASLDRNKGEENLQEITRKHEELINLILSEEEEVISLHRQHIDDMVDLVKQEMVLLHEVDKPASDIDEYVDSLDALLSHKLEMIEMLKGKLNKFRGHLKEEETLSKKFHEQKNEMMDIFDLNDGSEKEDDIQLLDNLQQVI